MSQNMLLLVALLALAALPGCKKHSHVEDKGCRWVFERYEPSAWEKEWRDGELSGSRRDTECEILATPPEVDRSVRLIRAVQGAVLNKKAVAPGDVELFSRMVYAERCGGRETGKRRSQLIEPLVGILRDPLTMCPRPTGVPDEVYNAFAVGEGAIQSKRHFLIGEAAPWSETPADVSSWQMGGFTPGARLAGEEGPRARQNFLIDIGSSAYGSWRGDPTAVGASWFVERFHRHGLSFDWVISYEYTKHDPDEIYSNVPADLLPHYIYFNQPVEKTPGGKWNPWRILKGMGARPEDYVVIKLDIDAPDIENPLIDQLMKDDSLLKVVDEVFYEHHVNTKVMLPHWGTQGSTILMADSYRNFGELRTKGVRMHSWP